MKQSTLTLLILTLATASSMSQPISSTFDLNDDGWRSVRIFASETFTNFAGPLFAPPYHPSGGNPGGTISCTDIYAAAGCEFVAPPKFLGDQSSCYGGSFSWDYRSTGGSGFPEPVYDIVIVGAGLILYLDLVPPAAANIWVHRTAALREIAGWRVGSLSGRAPTAAEFRAVLADLQGIFIESDLAGDGDTGYLDNVTLERFSDEDLISSIHVSAVDICWSGRTNQMYQVQYRTIASPTSWVDLGSPVLGTGTNCITDGINGIEKRFYRVTRVP